MKTAEEIMSGDYVSVGGNDSVSKVIGSMVQNKATEAFVFDKGKYKGMFLMGALLKARVDVNQMKIQKVTVNTPKLSKDDEIPRIAKLMFDSNATALPVFEDDEMVGSVHFFDVIRNIEDVKLLDTKISNVQHPEVEAIKQKDTIAKALKKMFENKVDRMPVVGKNEEIQGFLSYIDVLENYYMRHVSTEGSYKAHGDVKGYDPERDNLTKLPVSNFMNQQDAVTTTEDETLKQALNKMVENQVLSLLFTKGKKPTHILTRRNVLKKIKQQDTRQIYNVHYTGWNELDASEYTKKHAEKIISNYAEKLAYYIDNEFDVKVHVKQYNKEGTQGKFSVHLKVNYPGKSVASDNHHGWELKNALHDAFRAVETQLEKKFKNEKQIGKPTPRKEEGF